MCEDNKLELFGAAMQEAGEFLIELGEELGIKKSVRATFMCNETGETYVMTISKIEE